MTNIDQYNRAYSVEEVFKFIQPEASVPTRILCGGTDLLLKLRLQEDSAVALVDISDISELIGIEKKMDGIKIGSVTKMADVEQTSLLGGALKILAFGASQVGSPQIRNLASVGGNLCNASPSADTAAPLLALDAEVELISFNGRRKLKLLDFFIGPGKTALEKDEILSAIWIPNPPARSEGVYIKHSVRGAMELAMVGVAVVLWIENSSLNGRIALSAVAPTPVRAFKAETLLNQITIFDEDHFYNVAKLAIKEIKPITDVRASAKYRNEMAYQLTKRALIKAYQKLIGS